MMNHPDRSEECFEYNLGKALSLRCMHEHSALHCGSCEACTLTKQLNSTKAWFPRAGDQTRKRFALGLVRRLHSPELLQYVIQMLKPLLSKDFTYARTRTNPSLAADRATMSSDRSLNQSEVNQTIADMWNWYQMANYWTKSNFMLGIMQMCETHLLYVIGTQARTLLASELRANHPKGDYEASSIASSEESFRTYRHPDLALLSTVCSEYASIKRDPFMTESDEASLGGHTTSWAEVPTVCDDSDSEDSDSSLDPTLMVVPGSSKAYAGVARYRDFIHCLPVHLSKLILGLLDQVSLLNALCVSQNWRVLVEEVHKEFYVTQNIDEDVMLMQGASAHGCNPLYAKDVDVAVPNIAIDSWEAIRTDDDVIKTTFKSEVTFKTAYSGFSTRNVIIEERNVYCGAYNVMVLTDQRDPSRVLHTDGGSGRLIAIGSQDRRIRLIHADTGRQEPLVISGHAGSIRCVALDSERRFIVSGSYDTSIRKWSVETGKCQRIFRGHRDTVTCLQISGDLLVSGAKDSTCKVWRLESGKSKCIRSFKHRHPISAVAIGQDPLPEICLSGCEGGKVKVWDLRTGRIMKRLSGHHGPVMAIKFDRWHIVTGSKDGYALAWSAQGDHARCLTALRHPKAVLCLEFLYLRVLTGCEDGKVRIWNLLTGQCLRIMRGNSRSDPIDTLLATGNTVTVNTSNNLLVLNFEPVEYDYSLEQDQSPPLVQYGRYSDAPVRPQPYAYIRAQRMKVAGASNPRIVRHGQREGVGDGDGVRWRGCQTAHSARGLGRRSMEQAARVQSAGGRLQGPVAGEGSPSRRLARTAQPRLRTAPSPPHAERQRRSALGGRPRGIPGAGTPGAGSRADSRAVSRRSEEEDGSLPRAATAGVAVAPEDSDVTEGEPPELRRRVSWAFERLGVEGLTPGMSLADTKALLRSHIRARGHALPPDFVYLAVNAIQAAMKPSQAARNMELNRRHQEVEATRARRAHRPASCPSRLDPRTKIPVGDMDLDQLLLECGLEVQDPDVESDDGSGTSLGSQEDGAAVEPGDGVLRVEPIQNTVIVTEFGPERLERPPASRSLYSAAVRSSIPPAGLLRPSTVCVRQARSIHGRQDLHANSSQRPKSAAVMISAVPGSSQRIASGVSRPATGQSGMATSQAARLLEATPAMPEAPAGRHFASAGRAGHLSRSDSPAAAAASHVAMRMCSAELRDKMAALREERRQREAARQAAEVRAQRGAVSPYNHPMREHATFTLLTHQQINQRISEATKALEASQSTGIAVEEKRRRRAWLARVKGNLDLDLHRLPKPVAPKMNEFSEVLGVR